MFRYNYCSILSFKQRKVYRQLPIKKLDKRTYVCHYNNKQMFYSQEKEKWKNGAGDYFK